MAKAISSASDLLAAIAGKTVSFDYGDVTIELRSLEWAEVQTIVAQFGENQTELVFQMALAGIASPKVEEAQLRKAPVSFVVSTGRRVSELSGMAPEVDNRPLDGTGSSLPLATDQPT